MMFSALPLAHRQCYQALSAALEQLQKRVKNSDKEQGAMEESFQQVQQVYQDRIVSLSCEGLDPAIAPRWQSIQTETNRAMRLLQTDWIFLQSSRQARRLHQCRTACLERIELLLGYCQLLTRERE